MTQAEAAICLQISSMSMTMTRLVQSGIVPAEQPRPGLPTVIKKEDLDLDHVIRPVSQLKTSNNRPLSVDPNQLNSLKQGILERNVSCRAPCVWVPGDMRKDSGDEIRRISRQLLTECELAKLRPAFHEKADVTITNPETGAVLRTAFTRCEFEKLLEQHDVL
jgi:hypothetical protein